MATGADQGMHAFRMLTRQLCGHTLHSTPLATPWEVTGALPRPPPMCAPACKIGWSWQMEHRMVAGLMRLGTWRRFLAWLNDRPSHVGPLTLGPLRCAMRQEGESSRVSRCHRCVTIVGGRIPSGRLLVAGCGLLDAPRQPLDPRPMGHDGGDDRWQPRQASLPLIRGQLDAQTVGAAGVLGQRPVPTEHRTPAASMGRRHGGAMPLEPRLGLPSCLKDGGRPRATARGRMSPTWSAERPCHV